MVACPSREDAGWEQVWRVEKGTGTNAGAGTWPKNAFVGCAIIIIGESDAGRAAARETDSAGSRAGEMLRKSCRLGFFLEKTFSSFFILSFSHSPRVDGFRWAGRPSRSSTVDSSRVLDWYLGRIVRK